MKINANLLANLLDWRLNNLIDSGELMYLPRRADPRSSDFDEAIFIIGLLKDMAQGKKRIVLDIAYDKQKK